MYISHRSCIIDNKQRLSKSRQVADTRATLAKCNSPDVAAFDTNQSNRYMASA